MRMAVTGSMPSAMAMRTRRLGLLERLVAQGVHRLGVEGDLGAMVDAGLADRRRQVLEAVLGVAAAAR